MQWGFSRGGSTSGWTHGDFVKDGGARAWLHPVKMYFPLMAGYVPSSTYLTDVRKLLTGTSFSDLQATVQAWQPMQLS